MPSALWGSCALMMGMTVGCWWAFTYSREGYIPQMFGSIRAVCSAVSELTDFPVGGIMWGDCKFSFCFDPNLFYFSLLT